MDATLAAEFLAPPDRLDEACRIGCPADIGRGLMELSWIASRQQTVDGQTQAHVDLIRNEAAKKLQVGDVQFADRKTAIEKAVLDFADAHPELFEGAKTREFVHGALTRRACAAGVEFAEGKSAKDAVAKIESGCKEEGGFVALFKRILGKLKAASKITADRFLRVKVELDKSAVNKAWKEGEITKAELRSLAMRGVAAGEHEFIALEVRPWPVRSESEAPA